MSHITFAEIYGHEKGLKEGRTEGLGESLREALVAKFPQEGAALAAQLEGEQDLDRLKALLRAAVLAESPDDFRSRLSPPS
jgi:hypothetical protein